MNQNYTLPGDALRLMASVIAGGMVAVDASFDRDRAPQPDLVAQRSLEIACAIDQRVKAIESQQDDARRGLEAAENIARQQPLDAEAPNYPAAPSPCTRGFGHSGPCNGYPRYDDSNRPCWLPMRAEGHEDHPQHKAADE